MADNWFLLSLAESELFVPCLYRNSKALYCEGTITLVGSLNMFCRGISSSEMITGHFNMFCEEISMVETITGHYYAIELGNQIISYAC